MNQILFCIGLLLLSACSAQSNLIGTYSDIRRDISYNLKLNSDSTFTLVQKSLDVNAKCNGRWSIVSDKTIVLRCDSVNDVTDMLSSGFMSDRKKNVTILSHRKLRMEQVIFKKLRRLEK
jgi:hypothetical protein